MPEVDKGRHLSLEDQIKRAQRVGRHIVANRLTQRQAAKYFDITVKTLQRWLELAPPMAKCERCGRSYHYLGPRVVLCHKCRLMFTHNRERDSARWLASK